MARSSPYRPLPGSCADMKGDPADGVDPSRSLVGGDAEAPPPRAERGGRRRCAGACAALVAAAALAALLGLALARELQAAGARRELDALRRDVEALRARVDALDRSATAGKNLVSDLHAYEDGLYADLDSGENEEPAAATVTGARAAELDSITVLADDDDDEDDDAEDDDLYDDVGDDGESGFYQDYENRRKLQTRPAVPGTVPMPSEDFLGVVLSARPPDVPDRASKLSELRRMLHRVPDAAAPPPVAPVELAAGSLEDQRLKRSVPVDSPPEESVDYFASPRVFFAKSSDDRRKWKKYEEEVELPPSGAARPELPSPPRRARNSDDEVEGEATENSPPPQRRAFIAAHFHGNTSHLSTQTNEHYKGNGLINLPHEAHHSVWSPAEWTRRAPHPAPRLTRAGHVHVRHTGIYFVYVQIYYLDAHDVTGWVLHRTGAPDHGTREPVLQCASTSPSAERRDKPNSCYSAAALLLRAGDRLAVRNTGGDRHSLMQPEKSFIGLIKMADADADADLNDY